MEDGPGPGVVARTHTPPWLCRKRPAGSLDADSQAFKRTSNTIHRSSSGLPLQRFPYQGYDPHLRDAGSGWQAGPIDGSPPLGFAANNSGIPYLDSSPYSISSDGGFYYTGSGGQHDPAASTDRLLLQQDMLGMPRLHPPVAGNLGEFPAVSPPVSEPCLLLAHTTQSSPPLGPAPASAFDHTPSYTPSLPVSNGLSALYSLPCTHTALLAHDVSGSGPPSASSLGVSSAQGQVPAHSDWSPASYLHGDCGPAQVLTEGSAAYTQPWFQSLPSPGYPPLPTLPPDLVYSVLRPPHVMESHGHYDAPNGPDGHESTRIHPPIHDHLHQHGQESLPIRLPVDPHPYQQQTQGFGSYVQVQDSSVGQYSGQDGYNTLLKAELIDDADEIQDTSDNEVKQEIVPDTMSILSYGSQPQQSRQDQWVHISRTTDTQNPLYSRNNSIAESPESCGLVVVPENPALPDTGPERTRRRRFDSQAREETNITRKKKACVACRKQKIRCVANKDDEKAPCDGCRRRKDSSSGKIIHRTPCVRTLTVSSISIIRKGGLALTRRWEGTRLVDVVDVGDGAADSPIRTIHMLQGLSRRPIVIQVRKFTPVEGDVVNRHWTHNGKPVTLALEPYCLADIHKTADYFSDYLCNTALAGLKEAVYTSALVKETYAMVHTHELNLESKVERCPGKESVKKELEFFRAVIKLVWAMRHTTGSVWLAGEEKLGMTVPDEETHPGYPLRDAWTGEKEVSLPRMIVAQVDSIQNERILPGLLKKVLTDLENYMSSCKDEWFSMYLAVFMLLHEISVASQDRYRWAQERGQRVRYGGGKYAALGMYVENFQKASFPLLAYWHYYKIDELDRVDWDRLDRTKKIKYLEPEQAAFMRRSAERMREEAKHIPPAPACWEHDVFFVSHMFKQRWDLGYRTYNFMDE